MIRTIIFSKDRAMQLDLLLWSMHKFALQLDDVCVLWSASRDRFYRAYRRLMRDYKIHWYLQSAFLDDVSILTASVRPYIQFLVDDCVFYRPLECPTEILPNTAYAPRLGLNCTRCGNIGVPQSVPTQLYRDIGGEGDRDFDCTWSLDGHIYRREEIQPYLDRGGYSTPNELESAFCGEIRPRLYFPKHSCLTNVPHNSVGESKGNRHMHPGDDPIVMLNDLYLSDWRIDWNQMDFSNVDSCHMDLEYKYRRVNA